MSPIRSFAVTTVLLLCGSFVFAQQPLPAFKAGNCVLPVPKTEKRVECGFLTVPENRTKKNGKTIELPVVILKTDSADPKPDPVLKTLGGPGASSLRMVTGRRFSPWLKDRDFIIFEQRGTKYAQPSLECPEVDQAVAEAAKAGVGRLAARSKEVAAASSCYDRLTALGIDLNGYNSRESAADIEDLRRALKYKSINLYGVSYSARLMLDVVRYFPNNIRSLVLESTLPPEENYDEVGVDAIVRSLNVLFDACRRDAECFAAYPDLENEFYTVVSRLNKEPLVVERAPDSIRIDGNDFVTWIVDYLFSNEPAATIAAPYVVHEAFRGNYVQQFKQNGGPELGGSLYSWGMRYSVWCSEEIPFETASVIKAQSQKYARLKGYEVMALPDICRVWKVKPANRIENTAVTGGTPALFVGAQYDAYTDPAWARRVAKGFPKSFFVEIPWAGHGPGFSVPCVADMVATFIDDPSKAPTDICVTKTRSQFKFIIRKS